MNAAAVRLAGGEAGKTPGIYLSTGESPLGRVLRPPRILVVDDDRDAVLTLTLLLREDGYEVRSAADGRQALDEARAFDADAIVLDIALPGMSGFELARRIRARYGQPRPLLIAVSGQYKKESDSLLARINGFDHYLVKPYDPQKLLALVGLIRAPGPGKS